MGIDTFWGLVVGFKRRMDEADRAVTFNELREAGERYGKVMGRNAARAFAMLAMVALGNTAPGLAAKVPTLPGAMQAAAQAVSVPTYERLLELLPGELLARVEFGFIYFLMGEDGEASRQLGMAQALDPEHVQVLTLEAALARESTEKVRLYRRILQKEPLNEIARGKLRELGEMP